MKKYIKPTIKSTRVNVSQIICNSPQFGTKSANPEIECLGKKKNDQWEDFGGDEW